MRVFDNVFSNIRKYGDKHIVTVSLQVEKGNVLIRLKNRKKKDCLLYTSTFDEHLQDTLSYEEYLDLGLNGREDSAEKRAQIARSLYLGKPNAKTLFKRLNMLQLHKTDVEKLLGQPYE